MKKLLVSAVLALALAGCAAVQGVKDAVAPSPEAGIVNVSNAVGAAAALGTVLVKNNKLNAATAKSYSAILHTASNHLHDANVALLACRKRTTSTAATAPDPCGLSVAEEITLAASIVGDVRRALDKKQ